MQYDIELTKDKMGRTSLILVDEKMVIVEEVLLYLNYLEKKGLSKNSIDSYCRSLKHFYNWLDSVSLKFYEVKRRNIIDFVDYLNDLSDRATSAHTINKHISVVSSYYNYFELMGGFIEENPISSNGENKANYQYVSRNSPINGSRRNIFRQKTKTKRTNKRLFPQEIEILYDNINLLFNDPGISVRNELIFRLMYETGMRISECLGLRLNDLGELNPMEDVGVIYLVNHKIKYHKDHSFKTNERDLPVSMELLYDLDEYISFHRPHNDNIDTVFVNHRGVNKGLYIKRDTITKFFNKLSDQTGIYCTPHMLRHTHGTELVESGYDQEFIRVRLGHSSVNSTLQYMHISYEAQKKAYESFLLNRKGDKSNASDIY